jgi:hypothetical protein
MFTMNVLKLLWSEAVMIATYLINGMPSRVLGVKTSYEKSMTKMSSLFHQRCLGVRALLETIDLQSENWIHIL